MNYKLTPPPGSCGSFPQTRTVSVNLLWLESARPRSVEMRAKTHHPRAARDMIPRATFSFMIHVFERRGRRSVTAAAQSPSTSSVCGPSRVRKWLCRTPRRRRACSSGLRLALRESLPTRGLGVIDSHRLPSVCSAQNDRRLRLRSGLSLRSKQAS